MPRYTRNTVILAKTEVTYGVDPTPTGAANAMLTSKPQIMPMQAQFIDRDVIRGFLGGSEQLAGAMFAEISFDVELAGSGTAGTAPPYGPLLLACGLAETVSASVRVDYTPVSSAFSSAAFYWYDDGLLHKVLGARGTATFKKTSGGIPVISFNFKGLYAAPTAAANATPTLTGFQQPLAVQEANTSDLTIGGTHNSASTATPSITGGTALPSYGLEVALNNTVEHMPMLGGETIELTQRAITCNYKADLTAAQEVLFLAAIASGTLATLGIVHGTAAGNKSLLWLPQHQRINPRKDEQSGRRLVAVDGRGVYSTGNDDFRLTYF